MFGNKNSVVDWASYEVPFGKLLASLPLWKKKLAKEKYDISEAAITAAKNPETCVKLLFISFVAERLSAQEDFTAGKDLSEKFSSLADTM